MQNPPPPGYYPTILPGYPPQPGGYSQQGGYGGSIPSLLRPEEPDLGAALAEDFIHRCKSDKSPVRTSVSRPPPEEEFIRKCRKDQTISEEDFIRKCRVEQKHSVSLLPQEEEFIRRCRGETLHAVGTLPPEEEFIRKCRSGSRPPPPEEEFIRQCKAGSRPPTRSSGRRSRSISKSPVRLASRHIRSYSRSPSIRSRSPSRRSRSPTRYTRSRSRSPTRSASRHTRPHSRSPVRLSRSPIRSVSRQIGSHSKSPFSRSPGRSISRSDSWHPPTLSVSRTRSPPPRLRPTSPLPHLRKADRSISPRRDRPLSPTFRSQSGTFQRSRNREMRRDSRETRRSHSHDSCKSHSSNVSDEPSAQKTKRKELVDRWRMNNCQSKDEMSSKLEEISKMKPEDIIEKEKTFWTRTAPADLYYDQTEENRKVYRGTEKLVSLCERFETELIQRACRANEGKPPYVAPSRRHKIHHHRCCAATDSESDGSSSESGEEDEGLLEELERKKSHPDRLHPELWYNDPGEMNDGPLCRCSAKAKRSGIRHNIYAGELNLEKCNVHTNNADRLYHYRITVSPPNNFLIKTPTIIEHDNHEYIFEGFSMFSHKPLENLPVCKVIRFNIEYTILYIKEKHPEHFIIKELDLFYDYLFKEILELVDLDFKAAGDSNGCSQFHFMPRFVRELPENGKELLSMNEVLNHLLLSSKPLISMENIKEIVNLSNYKWQNYVDDVKGMVVTYPGKKPCSLRVDQLDRDQRDAKLGDLKVPEIVHFGIRPPQLSYAGNPEYQKAWREYVKFRHLLANMPKASFEDKRKLESKENKLQEMRTQSKMKRDVTIAISAEGFYRTGIMCDIVQHAMLIPVLVSHLRFHRSLDVLETDIKYTFQNRCLLQLALTHPSYRENFGTNPDHARNSLTNCSIRQPEYGDRRIHYLNTRKRGINTLINIMSRFGKKQETESNITHNERLEFLGDAVVEFVTSIHLFHLFPRLEEGGLATYRAAIVQNQHLAVLAKKLGLDGYMLYAHGSDLCHDLELRHAMANCFEALMGALFLDGGIDAADKVFGESLFKESRIHLRVWEEYPPHPLQEQEPNGDRQWIEKFQILQNLTKFEDSIGVQFTHVRLLARAFTDRSIGFTNLTLGSNQRLEFLGDTVLQLIASDYLYKYFPEHHEGHLSLLRSSLVNNRTQAVVCDDLGIGAYAIYATPKAELKTKDRADLLEAFLGALYVDKGLRHCEVFCNVCFFPRLHDFIMHQDWNDPKSKLQQCCLTLRTMEGGEPEIPIYKVIECMGPTNTRLYTVAVYFKGKRLAQATGHSIQQAEMNAAKGALDNSKKLFPQLDHQKRVIAKSIKQDPLVDKDNSKRGHSDGGDKNRNVMRSRNARGRSASVRSSSSRRPSVSMLNTQSSRGPGKEDHNLPQTGSHPIPLGSGILQNSGAQSRGTGYKSLSRHPSRCRSLSSPKKPGRTRSSSPSRPSPLIKQSMLRSPSPCRPRSPKEQSNLTSEGLPKPRSPSQLHNLSPSRRMRSPCRSRSPSPLKKPYKLRSQSPCKTRSSRPQSEQRKLSSPSPPPRIRSPSPRRPKSPSPLREQSKRRSLSPLKEPSKRRSPSLHRPRSTNRSRPGSPISCSQIRASPVSGHCGPGKLRSPPIKQRKLSISSPDSLSHAGQLSRTNSPSPSRPSHYQTSSQNIKVSPKHRKSGHSKTQEAVSSYPIERLSHHRSPARSNRPKNSSPTQQRPSSKSPQKSKRSSGTDEAGTKLHSRRASNYKDESRKTNFLPRDRATGSKPKDAMGEKIPTIDQIRHLADKHKSSHRKRPRADDSSPEKKFRRMSDSDKRKQRSNSRDRGSMTSYRAEERDRKPLSNYGCPVDTIQRDSNHDQQRRTAGYDRCLDERTRAYYDYDQQQRNPGYDHYLLDMTRKDSYHPVYDRHHGRRDPHQVPQPRKADSDPQLDGRTKKDSNQDQKQKKESPKKSRQRREPSDEGEILSESSLDSR